MAHQISTCSLRKVSSFLFSLKFHFFFSPPFFNCMILFADEQSILENLLDQLQFSLTASTKEHVVFYCKYFCSIRNIISTLAESQLPLLAEGEICGNFFDACFAMVLASFHHFFLALFLVRARNACVPKDAHKFLLCLTGSLGYVTLFSASWPPPPVLLLLQKLNWIASIACIKRLLFWLLNIS